MELKRGYKRTELGVVPKDWDIVSVGSLASFTSGAGISVAALRRQSSDTPFPVYGGNGIAGYTAVPLVREPIVVVGRVGQKCGDVYLTQGPAWVTDNALYPRVIFRPLCVGFLALALKAAGLNDARNRNDLPLITQSILHSVRIPLRPTEAEQQAIAEALSNVNVLIESLQQLIAKKRHLRQGAMQELLTGETRLPGFSAAWEVRQFGDFAQPRKERVNPRKTEVQRPCIELEHIEQRSGRLAGIGSTGEESSLKAVFQKGDVLFGKLRAYLRKYWLADRSGICSTEIWVLVAELSQVTPEFLFQLVTTDRFIGIASTAYGTHVPRSDWNVVKSYEMLLPSIGEQAAIAAILSDMDAEIAALEAKLDKVRQIKQGMMHNLLTGKIRLI